MAINGIELAWISVKDLKKAVKFYTEVVGLKISEMNEEYNWAELSGVKGGTMLGIAQIEAEEENSDAVFPGDNAVVTLTVSNLAESTKEMSAKGMQLHGPMVEVPGHVKMQMFLDLDGNKLQLVEKLY